MKIILLLILLIAISNANSYPQIENQVHLWFNKVRQNPRILIPYIQRQITKFHGKKISITSGFNQRTVQGRSAWYQAIQFLRRQRPLPPLRRHPGLDLSSKDHCHYLKRVNKVTHTGEHGSRLRDRIQKYSVYDHGKIGENIAQQFTRVNRNHGLETIVSLIIDDGIYDRGHRKSLFTKQYKYIGVSTQKNTRHYFTVINLSSENMKLKRHSRPRRALKVSRVKARKPVQPRVNPYQGQYSNPLASWWYNPFTAY